MEQSTWIEQLKNIFLYNEESPLIFTELYFWVFFGVVLGGYSIIYKDRAVRNAFLFLVSLFFYYKTSGMFFTILLFSTASDYYIGKAIYSSKKILARKLWLALSIFLNLAVLIYFKYAYFFADSFNQVIGSDFHPINHFAQWSNELTGSTFRVDQILLPVGISFFTFQTMSYSIDLYRNHVKPVKNLIDFGFYVSFFPQLVAGPIVRASEFIPQLYQKYELTRQQFGIALFWILNGLLKKMFLADYLAVNFIDRVFDNPGMYTGFENLMALYGYSLQVYADFSGYTDIAIGIALLLGFHLPENFNSPYKATSVGNFWKRWHISLSSWLRDYLYIPMGGNRGGSLFSFIMLGIIVGFVALMSSTILIPAVLSGLLVLVIALCQFFPKIQNWWTTNINMMLTMLIGGLWHGASWNFVIWGGLNGLGLMVYKLWRKVSPWENKNNLLKRFWAIFLTFNFITFTRIWFRSGSNNTWEAMREGHNILEELFTANEMLNRILFSFDGQIAWKFLTEFWEVMLVMVIGFIIQWLTSTWKTFYRKKFVSTPIPLQIAISFVVVFVLYQVMSAGMKPFIYFQF
jgi:D-alanyl-lipoteichoic acid acyltransferase DltB (MBOAT superfamily)